MPMTSLADIDLSELDLSPVFTERAVNMRDHGDYLEAFHEAVHRNLAGLHLILAKGGLEYAQEFTGALRAYIDTLWEHRREAVEGVAP